MGDVQVKEKKIGIKNVQQSEFSFHQSIWKKKLELVPFVHEERSVTCLYFLFPQTIRNIQKVIRWERQVPCMFVVSLPCHKFAHFVFCILEQSVVFRWNSGFLYASSGLSINFYWWLNWKCKLDHKNPYKWSSIFVLVSKFQRGLPWPWSYGSWIYSYLWNQCLSPLM